MDSVALSFDSCHTVSAFNTAIGNIKSQLQLKNWLHIKDGEKFKLSQLIQIFDRCVTSYKDVVIPTLTAFSCNIQRLFPHEMYDNEDQIYLQYFFEKMSIYSEASTYPWVAALIPDISQQTQYNFDDVLKKHIKILNQSLEDRYHQCLNYKLDSTSLPIMLRRLQEILSFLHMEVSFMKLSCTETEITLLAMTLKKLAISQNPSVAFEPKSNMQLSCNGESNELKDVEFMRELYEDSEMWGLYLSIISNLSRIHFMGDDETIYRTLSKLETQAKTFKETTKNKKFSDLLKHYLIYISFEKMHALGNIISTELFTCVKIINRSKFIKSSYAPVTTFSTPMCSLTLTMLNHFSRVFSYQIKFANLGVTKAESHEQFYRYRKAINDMWLKYSEQQKQFYFLVLEKLKGLIAPKHDIETSKFKQDLFAPLLETDRISLLTEPTFFNHPFLTTQESIEKLRIALTATNEQITDELIVGDTEEDNEHPKEQEIHEANKSTPSRTKTNRRKSNKKKRFEDIFKENTVFESPPVNTQSPTSSSEKKSTPPKSSPPLSDRVQVIPTTPSLNSQFIARPRHYIYAERVRRWFRTRVGTPLPSEDFPEYADNSAEYQLKMHVYHGFTSAADAFIKENSFKDKFTDPRNKEKYNRYICPADIQIKREGFRDIRRRGFAVYTTGDLLFHRYITEEKSESDLIHKLRLAQFNNLDTGVVTKSPGEINQEQTVTNDLQETIEKHPLLDMVTYTTRYPVDGKVITVVLKLFKATEDSE